MVGESMKKCCFLVLLIMFVLLLNAVTCSFSYAESNKEKQFDSWILRYLNNACDYFLDDSKLYDIAMTDIICSISNTIDQNIESKYGSLRHIIISAKLGLGLEESRNMQTFCNAIADVLNNSDTQTIRKLLFLTAKATKTVLKTESTVEVETLYMTDMLRDYSNSKFLGRNRYSQYAFLVRFLDIIKESDGNLPRDFRQVLFALMKSNVNQAKRLITKSVSDKDISSVTSLCDKVKSQKERGGGTQ